MNFACDGQSDSAHAGAAKRIAREYGRIRMRFLEVLAYGERLGEQVAVFFESGDAALRIKRLV